MRIEGLPAKGVKSEYHNFNEIVLYMRSRFVLYADKLIVANLSRVILIKFFIGESAMLFLCTW